MKTKLIFAFLLFVSFLNAQKLDVAVYGNGGAFGVVLDTFNAPLGPGFELGTQVSYNDFIAFGSVRRGVIGTKANKSTYGLIQAGLGGNYQVFFFSLSLDYMILDKRLEERTNRGGIGAGLRFGVDIPITEQIGFFGITSLGVNRMHTHMYVAGGVSYHFPFDMTARPSSFYE